MQGERDVMQIAWFGIESVPHLNQVKAGRLSAWNTERQRASWYGMSGASGKYRNRD